jgi:Uma2 family endonuclease
MILRIGNHGAQRGVGRAMALTGFQLSVEPPTVREPDVAFIAADRLQPEGFGRGFWPGAPDLAVEILSPSNRATEIQAKVLEYLDAGTRMVWVIDPQSGTATAYRSREDIRLLGPGDALDGADVLPGFRLPLSELFASG